MGAVCCNAEINNSKSEQLLDESNGDNIEVVTTNNNNDKDDELILLSDSEDISLSDLDQDDINDKLPNANGNLLTLATTKSFNESQTEILEKELKKQITKMSDQQSSNIEYIDNIDDLDSDDDDDDNHEPNSLEMNEENMIDKEERRPSNLFRAKSRNSWKSLELDEQESALKEQMLILQNSLSPKSVNDNI